MRVHFRVELRAVDKQRRSVTRHDAVRDHDRIEVDIAATNIEQPRNLVERRHNERIDIRLASVECCTHVGQLRRNIDTGIFDVQRDRWTIRCLWLILPN